MGKVLVAIFDDQEEDVFEKIKILLERQGCMEKTTVFIPDCLEYDGLLIDSKCRAVEKDHENIELTNYEFEILCLLAQHPGQVFSKEQIYSQVWREPYYGAEDNVASLIRRIRKKIEPDPSKPIYILTVWGIGYKFNNAIKRK